MSNADEKQRFELVLQVDADPLAKAHGERYARDGAYRLKLALKRLLRDFGLKCVSVHDARPGRGFQVKSAGPIEAEVSHGG